MLEDEIMYMGSRPASHSKSNRILSSSQATATATGETEHSSSSSLADQWDLRLGITLHVEKSGNEEPYRMMFRRANTSVVHIGRRPPAADDADRRTKDNESGRAMFRCPVVSRKHAKIAFSDSGYVCPVSSLRWHYSARSDIRFLPSLSAGVSHRFEFSSRHTCAQTRNSYF